MSLFKVNAQNEIDALRYSQNFNVGTARFNAMGGAFGALGADFSTLSINPAGIGLYKGSEFTITPSLSVGGTNSTYNNSPSYYDNKYNFSLGNVGIVYDFYKSGKYAEGNGWKDVQFGFGINRLNDYNNNMTIQGSSSNSSMMTEYLDYAKGYKPTDLNDFDTKLAYKTFLLNPIGDSTQYMTPIKGTVIQRKTSTFSGSANEFAFTLGGNYSNKIYIGATIGVPFVKYNEQSLYTEKDSLHNSFSVSDNLNTTGTGVNVKLGIIYRPNDMVRIGFSFHSPTFYSMQDQWTRRIDSQVDSGSFTAESPQGVNNYQITTPMHFIGSIAFIIGQYGLISADYEFIDYSSARIRADGEDFFNQNQNIQNNYTSTNNIRIGTEWRLNPITLRAGYAYYQSPFKTTANDASRNIFSLGIGFKEKGYFLDFSYSYSIQKEDYYFYDPAYNLNPVKNTLTGSNIMMTLGFKY